MSLAAPAPPVSAEWHARITGALSRIAEEERLSILLAVESGSRAWGFHSTDSDYDVRFIYTRPLDWHLSVTPGRDVVERPISDLLDLSGWDLRKTLGLMLRSNAVALEWLQSPIRYVEVPGFREALLEFGTRVLGRRPLTWHYTRLAIRQREHLRDGDGRLRFKRYFYTVRPVLALRWLRLNPGAPLVPMDMEALMAATDLDTPTQTALDALIAQKRSAVERATLDTAPPPLDRLIETEIDLAETYLKRPDPAAPARDHAAADALHIAWTRRMEGDRP